VAGNPIVKQQTLTSTGKVESIQKGPAAERHSSQPMAPISPNHGLLALHQQLGNQALGYFIQAKLTVSRPGDTYEQEADQVADQIMRMADPSAEQNPGPIGVSVASPHVQRACAPCAEGKGHCDCESENKDDLHLHAKTNSHEAASAAMPGRSQIAPFTSGGEPLAERDRSFFEPRFGYDLSHVRVHRDSPAFDSARSVNALAYTMGHHVVFGAGQYAPETESGRRLLAHELTHVIQQGQTAGPAIKRKSRHAEVKIAHSASPDADQRTVAPAIQASPANLLQRAAGNAGAGAPAPAKAGGFEIDVLAAEGAEDFLLKAAARALGVDIRVSSMDDMITKVEGKATAGTCVKRLNIYNHANPALQMVAGGNKVKTATGEKTQTEVSGFSLDFLTANANQGALNRLRHSFCCDGQMNWWGCSTAGVWTEGSTRSAAEQKEDEHRFTGVFGNWYHDVADAAAHGATAFKYIGPVNVQSWANALCVPVVGATDFNDWKSVGGEVFRTVIHGGRQLRIEPQADVGCGCDPAAGRISGSVQTSAQLQQRATELRQQFLNPLYERTRGVVGSSLPAQPETAAEKTTREASEQAQAAESQKLGDTIREAVLAKAGFAAGARATTSADALKVAELWGLKLDDIVKALPTLTTSLSGMLRGSHEEAGLDQQQRNLEAAMTQPGRESFMTALMLVRRDRFWNDYLTRNTVYIFPDLTGVNRYRGFTQTATRNVEGSKPQTIFVIHVSKDLLESGNTEMVSANIVHELSHSIYSHNQIGSAMQNFETDLAGLIVDHPSVIELRKDATDAAAARNTHLSRIRQMLYEVTGYAEEEIFVHLQQLTHQPSMTINNVGVGASDFILSQVTMFMRRLRKIGLPPRVLTDVLRAILKQTAELYDKRIAAAPEGSSDRKSLEVNKDLAIATFKLALDDSAASPKP